MDAAATYAGSFFSCSDAVLYQGVDVSGGMVETMEMGLLTYYSDVKSEPVKWLWYPYIAIGKITLLKGDPGDGKSTMMMNFIAELSKGGATPDGVAFGRPHKIGVR